MKYLLIILVGLTWADFFGPSSAYFFCPAKRIVDNTFGVAECDVNKLGSRCKNGGTCCLDEESDFTCYPDNANPPFVCPHTNIVDTTPGLTQCDRKQAGLTCPSGGVCCPDNEGDFACYERKLTVPPTCPTPAAVSYAMGILNCEEPVVGSVCSNGGLCCPSEVGNLYCYITPPSSPLPCPPPSIVDSTQNLARCKANLIGSTCYNSGTCCPDSTGDLYCYKKDVVPGCPRPLVVDTTGGLQNCNRAGGKCGRNGVCCPDLDDDLHCYTPKPRFTSKCPSPKIVDETPNIKNCEQYAIGASCGDGCTVCPNEQGKHSCYKHPIADPRHCPAPNLVGSIAGLPPCDVEIPGAACDDTGICCPNHHGQMECFVQNPIYPEQCPPPPAVFGVHGTQTCVYGVPGTICNNGRGICCRDQYNELLCHPL